MKAVVLAMLLEASRLTGLPMAEPPKVTYLTAEEMANLSRDPRTLGMYVCIFRRMYLQQGFDVEEIRNQALLLHELVHHLQCRAWGVRALEQRRCRAERMAYEATITWLGKRGRDFYRVFRWTPSTFERYMTGACP